MTARSVSAWPPAEKARVRFVAFLARSESPFPAMVTLGPPAPRLIDSATSAVLLCSVVATAEVNAVPVSGPECDRSYTAAPAPASSTATAATVTIGQTRRRRGGAGGEPQSGAAAVWVGVGGRCRPRSRCALVGGGGGGGGDDALNAYLLLVGSGAEAGTEPESARVRLGGSPDALEESGEPLVILERVVRAFSRCGPRTGGDRERVRSGRLPVRVRCGWISCDGAVTHILGIGWSGFAA